MYHLARKAANRRFCDNAQPIENLDSMMIFCEDGPPMRFSNLITGSQGGAQSSETREDRQIAVI